MLGLFVLSCIAERQSKMKIRQIRNATLRAALERRGLAGRVLMPDDGKEYSL
jgi:hypothetical protein